MELMKFGNGMSMSLRSACFLLGLKDPKLEVSGDDVFKLFKQKDMTTIASYVEGDVKATYEVFRKLKNLAL
jgi:predicted PolB exonuclease-like 3'-5' exonuclease